MIKNYFKTAFRNLWQNKTFSFLNIAGLAIGIAAWLRLFSYGWKMRSPIIIILKTKQPSTRFLKTRPMMRRHSLLRQHPRLLAGAMKDEIPGIDNGKDELAKQEIIQFGR